MCQCGRACVLAGAQHSCAASLLSCTTVAHVVFVAFLCCFPVDQYQVFSDTKQVVPGKAEAALCAMHNGTTAVLTHERVLCTLAPDRVVWLAGVR